MTTLELTKQINSARKECKVSNLRHSSLLVKCRHLFGDNLEKGSYKAGKRSYPYYELTPDQLKKLIDTESEAVTTLLTQLCHQPEKVSQKRYIGLPETNVKSTMTSLEVCDLLNQYRHLDCRYELTHSDLLKVIRDEFDDSIDEGRISQIFYYDKMNRKQPYYELTLDQVRCIMVRESKKVRRMMIKYLSDLEENNRLLLHQLLEAKETLLMKETNEADYWYDRADKLEAELKKLKKGSPVVNNKVPDNYDFLLNFYEMTTLNPQFATIPAIKSMYGLRDNDINIEALLQYSSFRKLPIEKVVNPATGRIVNAYHVIAWSETHGVSF